MNDSYVYLQADYVKKMAQRKLNRILDQRREEDEQAISNWMTRWGKWLRLLNKVTFGWIEDEVC